MAVLTEEQSILKDAAAVWARERSPVTAFRKLRNSGAAIAYDPAVYAAFADMGWTGIIVPEVYGGSNFGCFGMGLVLEELGRNLTASPLLSSAVGAASALVLGGSEAQKQKWLAVLAEGKVVGTLAVDEGPRHAPLQTAMAARQAAGGWVLNGIKRPVLEGMAASLAVVAARASGVPGDAAGITLFLVDLSLPGVSRQPLQQIDSRGAAVITFTDVKVSAGDILGQPGEGFDLLDKILDRVRACQAAEMLGTATQAFETTVAYLKTRVQFGQLIGTFQALQHRAAALCGELEVTRSAVEAALAAIDADRPDAAALVSLAKAMAGETLHLASNEMVQMHGGIGMTDEHDAGLYMKRARAAEAYAGNAAYHRERYGRLNGY